MELLSFGMKGKISSGHRAICIVALGLVTAISIAHGEETREYSDLASTEVVHLARQHNLKAIGELGFRGDKSNLPVLRRILFEDSSLTAKTEARIALARLGDPEALNFFIRGLRSKDEQEVSSCINNLGRIGNPATARHLVRFLNDDEAPELTRPPHPATMPHEFSAVGSLSMIFPKAAAEIETLTARNHTPRVDLWKTWWETHKSEFSK